MERKTLLLLLLISFGTCKAFSQIIAGSGSSGLIISNPSVNLSVTAFNTNALGFVDLDCDSVADIQIDLRKGASFVDFPNMAFLYVLNPHCSTFAG